MGRDPSRFRWMAATLMVVLVSANAHGQGRPEDKRSGGLAPLPGLRLRVTAPSESTKPIVGTLVEVTDREIVLSLAESARKAIARTDVTRLERSEGRKRHAGKGALIGAGIGVATIVAMGAFDDSEGEGSMEEGLAFGAIFGAAGAAAGAIVGGLIRTERWSELPANDLRVSLRPSRNRGLEAALTWSW
jgi:hypothetical protein